MAGENSGQAAHPIVLGLSGDSSGHWLALTDKYDPSAGAEVVRVRARLLTDCSGAQCPAAPDGGAVRPDGGGDTASPEAGRDAGYRDAVVADGVASSGADSAPEVGTSAPADARASDAAAEASPDVPGLADAGPAGDATSPAKPKPSGCSCRVGGAAPERTASVTWLLVGLCAALLARGTKRWPRRR